MQDCCRILLILTLWSAVSVISILFHNSIVFDSCSPYPHRRNKSHLDKASIGKRNSSIASYLNAKRVALSRKRNVIPSDDVSKVSGSTEKSNYRCTPTQTVVFLKTHKTGSSTITNILNRYADLNELLVALPANGDSRFLWPAKFHWTSVDLTRLDGEPANLIANHARYERKQMDTIMKKDAKYITILRHPVDQFESSFYYFEYDKWLALKRSKHPIRDFLAQPDQLLHKLTMEIGDLPEAMNLIQSGMLYDLGYDFTDFENETNIHDTLRQIKSEFHVVMIMEYFDESLIILMYELCWKMDDILYIKFNEQIRKKKKVDGFLSERILKWSQADWMLYQYFNHTLWEKIRSYGGQFWRDLNLFREQNRKMTKICSPSEIVTNGFRINVQVKSMILNKTIERYHKYFCRKMFMDEIEYLKYFRIKFGPDYGYQKVLINEGIKKVKSDPGELKKKIKSLKQK